MLCKGTPFAQVSLLVLTTEARILTDLTWELSQRLHFAAGDDGIAMHGGYYAVAATDPDKHTITVASTSGFPFINGDTLIIYGANTEVKASAVIEGSHSVDQPDSTSGKISKSLPSDRLAYDDCDFLEVRSRPPCLLPAEVPDDDTDRSQSAI